MVYVIEFCWQLASRIREERVPPWSCSQAVCTVKNSWRWTEELSETCRSSVLILLASCQQTCMTYTIAVYDGQRNCPKHLEFYSKNKFEKLVRLVSFIIRMYHDARSYDCQKICMELFVCLVLVCMSVDLSVNRPVSGPVGQSVYSLSAAVSLLSFTKLLRQ